MLGKCITLSKLKKDLHSLPNTLDETYNRILVNIDDAYYDYALKVLLWLALSACPLTLAEVAEVLAINCDSPCPTFDCGERPPEPRDILDACSSLVTISTSSITVRKNKDTLKTAPLSLAHLSVKEYLMSERIKQHGVASRFYLNRKSADTVISRACLGYLLQFEKPKVWDKQRLREFPLARYAAKFWLFHARSEDNTIDDSVQPLIINLLHPGSGQFLNWVQLFDNDTEWPPSIYYASLFGLEMVTRQLLRINNAADINMQGGEYGSALHAAAGEGHEGIVRLLLENGADVNAHSGYYGSSLQMASKRGHMTIVQLLIDGGADVNGRGGTAVSPLQEVMRRGEENIARQLIELGADVSADGGYRESVLHIALGRNLEGIAQLLIKHGADVNADGGFCGSPLQVASRRGLEVVVEFLIKNGADVNAQGAFGASSLHVAASEGHEGIVRLLVENGADVNVEGEFYGVPAQIASSMGHEAIARLLSENENSCDRMAIDSHQLPFL